MIKQLDLAAFGVVVTPAPMQQPAPGESFANVPINTTAIYQPNAIDFSAFVVARGEMPVDALDLLAFRLPPSVPALDLSAFAPPAEPACKVTPALAVTVATSGLEPHPAVSRTPTVPTTAQRPYAFPKFRSLLESFFSFPREIPPAPGSYKVEVWRKSPPGAHYVEWWSEFCHWDGQYWSASPRGGRVAGWQMPDSVERTEWFNYPDAKPIHYGCYDVEYTWVPTGEVVPAMMSWLESRNDWCASPRKIIRRWRGLVFKDGVQA